MSRGGCTFNCAAKHQSIKAYTTVLRIAGTMEQTTEKPDTGLTCLVILYNLHSVQVNPSRPHLTLYRFQLHLLSPKEFLGLRVIPVTLLSWT